MTDRHKIAGDLLKISVKHGLVAKEAQMDVYLKTWDCFLEMSDYIILNKEAVEE